jgi:hypothetical protein
MIVVVSKVVSNIMLLHGLIFRQRRKKGELVRADFLFYERTFRNEEKFKILSVDEHLWTGCGILCRSLIRAENL